VAGAGLDFQPLSSGLLEPWLAFFDRVAFADNPGWAGCYCHFPLADHDEKPWESRGAAENRTAAISLVQAGRLRGWVALEGGAVVGWCHAGPREAFTILDPPVDPPAGAGAAIVCFLVAPAWRRRGVGSGLLTAACAGLTAQGFAWVEAWPRREAATAAAHYHGPLSMYHRAGFQTLSEDRGVLTLRRGL
jgi:GNAT superfamily N-acetyltransferase